MNVGTVSNTRLPEPVEPTTQTLRLVLVGDARKAETLVPRPVKPDNGNVQLVNVPLVGVPSIGVISVGDVPKTFKPVPVDVVRAANRFAELGVARNALTPAASPDKLPTV